MTTDAADGGTFFAYLSGDPPPGRTPAAQRRILVAGLGGLAVILAAALALAAVLIADRRAALEAELSQRLAILAETRSELLAAWLDGRRQLAARISESELFRLFATELAMTGAGLSRRDPIGGDPAGSDLSGGDLSGSGARQPGEIDPLVLQLPYMEQLLTDFVRDSDFLSAHLIGSDGRIVVQSAGGPSLTDAQRRLAGRHFRRAAPPFGPARPAAGGLVSDLVLPVFPVQSESGAGRPVALLLVSLPVAKAFAEVLAPGGLSRPGERLRLLQVEDAAPREIAPGEAPPLRALGGASPFDTESGPEDGPQDGPANGIAFAQRAAIAAGDGAAPVYSAGAAVPGTVWWIVQEAEAAAAQADLAAFERTAIAVAGLVVVSLAGAFAALWWRMADSHSRSQAEQFRQLAARIDAQRRLLDSINGTIADYIALKDLAGRYRYVNAAFARALGRPPEQLVGLDDAALFGRDAAERLKLSDARALETAEAAETAETAETTETAAAATGDYEVVLGGKRRQLQISKVAFAEDGGRPSGIVWVARDVSELVEARRREERAKAQLVSALVRAIELRDPYLAGHSKRVAGFATETARRLGAAPQEIVTVEIAAHLSQIGKLAIPRGIMTKSERLSGDEIAVMQSHVDQAGRVLQEIDFDLPILETVAQMHERLDGTGYPKGLAGDAISRAGLVLGACDVFCARIEPRAYRRGIDPQAALRILQENAGRYHPEVVAALAEVVRSAMGDRLVASIDAA
jgi:PAS domain S-box-containing protein